MNGKKIGKLKCYSSKEIEKSMVSIGFECLDRELFDPEKCYDLLGQTGIKRARCQTGWARCEKEKGVYDFEWLDLIVDNLRVRGIQPWFNVGFGNPLYMPDVPNPTAVGCVPLFYGKETIEAWKRFVQALAAHFRGRVAEYEIWNEPNIEHFWYPEKPSGKKYAELVQLTGAVIRKEIATCRIGACVSGTFEEGPTRYITEFAESLNPGELDFFCYHCYLWIPEEGSAKHFGLIKKIFAENGHTKLSYWNGEAGHASWYPDHYWHPWETQGNEHRQAVWQLRRFFLDRTFPAEVTSFFQMVDMWQKPYQMASLIQNKPAAQGILNGITYTPKKSYETIQRLALVLSGDIQPSDFFFSISYPKDPVEMMAVQTVQFTRDGNPIYVYWRPTDVEKEKPQLEGVTVKLGIWRIPHAINDPVWIDMLSGDVFEIEPKERREEILVLSDLPLPEHPVLICDRKVFAVE